MKRALVTGITGQEGSYLAELLLENGYEVHGVIRRPPRSTAGGSITSTATRTRQRLHLHYGDLTDGSQLARLIRTVEPDEIYNLGAQSHVMVSFEQPEYTGNVGGIGVTRLLEAIRETGIQTRLYQAASSEMFGDSPPPQSEDTPFRPRSPYAAAKLYAYWITRNYREAYGMFAVSGILFNHENERRGETFVTRKISTAVARIAAGLQDRVYLGNLDAVRDWGHAKDYVRAMYLMLQQDEPEDYVIGTGQGHTVRDFGELAFGHVGLEWEPFMEVDPHYFRTTEVDALVADPSKARIRLGWEPTVSFQELVTSMVEADLTKAGLTLQEARARVAGGQVQTPV